MKKTYLRWYTTIRPEFVPIHPEWTPPEFIHKKSLKTYRCSTCHTLIVRSKPWTFFQCFTQACQAIYHWHCINLHTRIAIEDGLLPRWICCGYDCLVDYPFEDSGKLLELWKKNQYMICGPVLTISKSFAQVMLGPEVIAVNTTCKLWDARSCFLGSIFILCRAFSKQEFNNKKQACYSNMVTATSSDENTLRKVLLISYYICVKVFTISH